MNKYSKQREEVLDTLKQSHTHMTAEEIYAKLKKTDSTASKGTVYRNLKVLEESATIIKISIPDHPDKYDYVHTKHHHVICRKCGKAYDFNINDENLNSIKASAKEQTKIAKLENEISMFGICENCINLKEEKQ